MADLSAALAAVREALHEHDAYGMPIDAGTIRDLLAALDAAQGEAVAWRWEEREYNDEWKVRHGEAVPEYENQPRWVRNAAPLCLAPPAAPRVERYGDGVLVHWPEGVEQYVQVGDCVTGNIAAPPAAAPEGMVMVQLADIRALEAVDFGRCGWRPSADAAARRIRAAALAERAEVGRDAINAMGEP